MLFSYLVHVLDNAVTSRGLEKHQLSNGAPQLKDSPQCTFGGLS